MKIVLDTNVLVSAFATRGLCQDIFELCLAEHKIVLSHFILQETHNILTKKIKVPQSMVNNIHSLLISESEIVVPLHVPQGACRDRNDLKILGTALSGKVDAIITGDNDLLDIEEFETIPILSPRKFWNLMQNKGR